jgi:hypothetical protein
MYAGLEAVKMRLLMLVVVCLLAVTVPFNSQALQSEAIEARLEVVLSTARLNTSETSVPFFLRLPLDREGILRFASTESNVVELCPTPQTPQDEATQLHATVSRNDKRKDSFDIKLVISERARVGCRLVGDLLVPVFTNRVIEKTVTLADGDKAELPVLSDRASNTEKKLEVRLSIVEKKL